MAIHFINELGSWIFSTASPTDYSVSLNMPFIDFAICKDYYHLP